jgi:SP family sugar:H+ symporter-like MFS transporter
VQSLTIFWHFSGVNFIFYYGTQFFLNSGIQDPFTITIITSVINTVSTIPGMYAMDKLGRRFLLMYGAFGMALSQLIVAIVGSVISVNNLAGQRVLIAFVCIFIAHFAATW